MNSDKFRANVVMDFLDPLVVVTTHDRRFMKIIGDDNITTEYLGKAEKLRRTRWEKISL